MNKTLKIMLFVGLGLLVCGLGAWLAVKYRSSASSVWPTHKADDGTTVRFYMVNKNNLCFAVVNDGSSSTSFQVPCTAVMVDAQPLKEEK